MNKLFIAAMFLVGFVFIVVPESHAFFSNGKITIKVIDEDGAAIDGARVGIGFDDNRSKTKENSVVGLTNNEGKFSGNETTTSGYLAFNVTKDGFYKTTGEYQFGRKKTFRWAPWNPELTVVLRKIENPVPMYARSTIRSLIEIPVIGENIGFDLEVFDWVIPYGNGLQSDLIFNLKRLKTVSRQNYDATLTISFSNKADGIQQHRVLRKDGSQFKLSRYAPGNGYKPEIVLHESYVGKEPVKLNFDFRAKDLNYIFRVRTREKDGGIVEAMYGKIMGNIDFSAMRSKTAKIYFKYYLNPDGTRNLEFDPKRNLFVNLPSRERVIMP